MYNNVDVDPLVGTLFANRYLINFLVARGGMGNIYQANDVKRGHVVALKMLRAEFSNDKVVLRRFEREAEAVTQLKHPNICQLFDTGCTPDGIHYFTMEYLEGMPLDSILGKQHVLEPQTAIYYISQVAAALCDAHNHNIIHRDLKPANIFVVQPPNAPEYVKVLDFGVAKVDDQKLQLHEKLTNAGSTLGTPFYMSPEQIQGLDVDGRTDVYALGIILWECLFGAPPFTGNTLMDIFKATITQKLPKLPPEVRADQYWRDIHAVLKKALEKDRKHRYASMQEFLRALESLNRDGIIANRTRMSTPRSVSVMPLAGLRADLVAFFRHLTPVKIAIITCATCLVIGAIVIVALTLSDHEEKKPDVTAVAAPMHQYRFYADVPTSVLLNGNPLTGKTPQTIESELKPPFTVVFMTEDAPDFSVRYTTRDPDIDIVSFAVNMKAERTDSPELDIDTIPSGADIYVSGIYMDKTPCVLSMEPDDQFHLIIQKEGYKVEDIYVTNHSGNMRIRSNLQRKPKTKPAPSNP